MKYTPVQYQREWRKAERRIFLVILLVIGLWNVKQWNRPLKDQVDELHKNAIQLVIKEGELLDQTAEASVTLKNEDQWVAKIAKEETARKNNEAYKSLTPAEKAIIQKESSFNPSAKSTTSTAFGLCQLIKANRLKYAQLVGVKDPNTIIPHQQISMCRKYISNRYGTAEKALSFHEAYNYF
jgi:hypothetical protein